MSDGLDIAASGDDGAVGGGAMCGGVEVNINREDLGRHGLFKCGLAPALRSLAITVTEQSIDQYPIKGSLHSSNKELS
ncbi:hypothetical protein [Vibrio atlanticus]|uniref:hypothetical protein n=1 Tax=Vibrio atlanticus TaxID=693153 RepID=UPI003D0CBB47